MPSDSFTIPLHIASSGCESFTRVAEPITAGIPVPKGVAFDATSWRLLSAQGRDMPAQIRVLDRWSDGSVRWALVDSNVTVRRGTGSLGCSLCLHEGRRSQASTGTLAASTVAGGSVRVDCGGTVFDIASHAPALIAAVRQGGREALDASRSQLCLRDANGLIWPIRWSQPVIAEAGPNRAVIRVEGGAVGPDRKPLGLTARLHFYAGLSVVRVLLTIHNPARARHRGGFWELGDEGSVLLRELSLVMRLPAGDGPSRLRLSTEPGLWHEDCHEKVAIQQESSGGEHWNSGNHIDRKGSVAARFRGYRGVADGAALDGDRATPIVVLERDGSILGATVPQFWQNFPREVSASGDTLTVSFFPSGEHELQGGEQKTHECYMLFGDDSVTESPLEWARSRLVVHASPDWYARSEAVPYLVPAACDPHEGYLSLVSACVEGPEAIVRKRERIDEYGWRHFGDIHGDHESAFHSGPVPLVSHYNNQYDAIAGCAAHFMRTGDLRWWTACDDLASHVIDIDIYHTDLDKSAYNHGMFWHTSHYVDAGKSTHRSYPRGTSTGGGPSCEHLYTTGVMLHYFMTGSEASRAAVLELARYVIEADDGSKTIFKWLDRGYTGLASASRTPDYHGPGRGAGNALSALLDGHRVSGDRSYLEKAEQLIRRCTHPRQDLAKLTLLDAENRWFYTVFLGSLGRYLDYKIELNELDAMYGYGRDVLLTYARWMAPHEYPYLDKPEALEFPTETWAAQDLRKAEIFDYAARHTEDEEERSRFRERAEFFFQYSISTLEGMATRTLTRPMVLLLGHGFMRGWAARHPDRRAPLAREGWEDWPVPEEFVPQKTRAKGRLKVTAAAAAAGLVALAQAALLMLR